VIIRGTTPTLTFGLPFDTSIIDVGYVVVKQDKETIIEKPTSACDREGNTISVTLTQEETLGLVSGTYAEISVVVKTSGGERLEIRRPIIETVADTAKDGVI
jgi:hypothetical protein